MQKKSPWLTTLTPRMALAAALAIAATAFYQNRAFYHDDAYITLRYARNVLAGNGAVWNPGEYLQGYTSPLELWLVVLLGRLGMDLHAASQAIGLTAFALLVWTLFRWRNRFAAGSGPQPLAWLPVVATLSSCSLILWSLGGLETLPFCLFTTLGLFHFMAAMAAPARRADLVWSSVFFSLAFHTRPDGAIFLFVAFIWLLCRRKDFGTAGLLGFLIPGILLIAPYWIWQFLYYGDILPNTFYAKAGDLIMFRLVNGYDYLMLYAFRPPHLFAATVLVLVLVLVRRTWPPPLRYLAISAFAYVAYLVWAGGDHMQAFRLISPLIPAFALIIFLGLQALGATSRRFTAPAVFAVVTGAAVLQFNWWVLNPRVEDPAARVGTLIGKYIAGAWPENSLIALNTAGSTPYYAFPFRYIDMLGLNDRHIARRKVEAAPLKYQQWPGHLKGDGDYVLSRGPDFIITGGAAGQEISEPWFLSDLEMSQDERFLKNYEKQDILLDKDGVPSAGGKMHFIYYRKTRAF
jgi:arabinofuranosyltransferase